MALRSRRRMPKQRNTKRFPGYPPRAGPSPEADYGGATMARTPWGDSRTLRERRLPPGRGRSRKAVCDNQRERLFAAMVATVAEKGYEATRVADLVELSGVSRKAFYEHFDDKQDCFLATLDEILSATAGVMASRLQSSGTPRIRAKKGALGALVQLVVAQPAAARMCLVEAYAAGPAAVARIDSAMAAFQALLQKAFRELHEGREMPMEMVQGLVDGIRKIVHTRLHRGVEAELVELVPDLLELLLSYQPPPQPLRRASRQHSSSRGRPDMAARKTGDTSSGMGIKPLRYDGDTAERITRATMAAVARKGFSATTIADIVEIAGISLSTFYTHFDSKAHAFDAALYGGRARLLSVAMPAYRRARNWPEAVRSVAQTSLAFLSQEPEFTRLVTVDVFAAGPEALEHRDQALESMQQPLDGGLEHAPQLPRIAQEAIISSVYAMVCNWVRDEGIESLPEMAPLGIYMALCPFIGPEEACKVARNERRGGLDKRKRPPRAPR